jgi:hypothetical protein
MDRIEEKKQMISKFIDNFLLVDFEIPYDYDIRSTVHTHNNMEWLIVNIVFNIDVDRYIFEDGTNYIKQLSNIEKIPDTIIKYLGLSYEDTVINISFDYVNDEKLNRDLDSLRQNVIDSLIREYQITVQDIENAGIYFFVYQSIEDNPYISIECQVNDITSLEEDDKIEDLDFENLVYNKSRNYNSIQRLVSLNGINFFYD